MSHRYTEKDIDKGIEIWQLNDIDIWVGWGFDDIVKGALKQTGVPRDELLDSPYKVTRDKWDKTLVADYDADYQPRLTYSNMIMKDILTNVSVPYCMASAEY